MLIWHHDRFEDGTLWLSANGFETTETSDVMQGELVHCSAPAPTSPTPEHCR